MINKESVERYLRANGIEPSAPEEEIKQVLFSAKWHHDDVDTALMVLRENPETHETHVDSFHKIFHPDDRLQPETISALLGIDVQITSPEERIRSNRPGVMPVIIVILVGGALSCGVITLTLWLLEMGPFYVA